MDNSLLLKIVCGGTFVAGGTIGVGGYFANKKGFFDSEYEAPENTEILDYLIVKSISTTNNNEGNQGQNDDDKTEMYEKKMFSFKVKVNFFCSLKDASPKEENCEIYKLSDKEKQLGSLITNNYSATNKRIKEEGNFFKIKINKEFQDQINEYNSDRETINIIKKYDLPNVDENSTNDSNEIHKKIHNQQLIKEFARFIPIYRVQNGQIIDRSKSVLFAKTSSTVSIDSSLPEIVNKKNEKNYQCQIQTKQFDCHIKPVAFNPTKKSFHFFGWNYSNENQNLPTKSNLSEADKYFQIKMTEEDLKNIDLSKADQTIEIISKPNNQKYATLKADFFVLDNQIFKQNNDFYWIIKKNKETNSNKTADSTWKEKYTMCHVLEQKIDIQCEIYKWDSPPDASTSSSDLDFTKKLNVVDGDSISDEKDYVVKLSKKNEDEFKTILRRQNLVLKSKTSDKKTYSFLVWSQLVGNMTKDNPKDIFIID